MKILSPSFRSSALRFLAQNNFVPSLIILGGLFFVQTPRVVVDSGNDDKLATAAMYGGVTQRKAPRASALDKHNFKLAAAANAAIYDSRVTDIPGMCQKATRQTAQLSRAYGSGAFSNYFDYNARTTALNFYRDGLGFPKSELAKRGGLRAGDVLYKTTGSGNHGHVGIYVGRVPGHGSLPLVMENSSTTLGRIKGAKGYRTLAQYGHYNIVVRLPNINEVISFSK